MKKELGIFVFIFVLLALGMHYKEWMDHPLEHVGNLFTLGWFGVHPLVIALAVYLIFVMFRGIIRYFRR